MLDDAILEDSYYSGPLYELNSYNNTAGYINQDQGGYINQGYQGGYIQPQQQGETVSYNFDQPQQQQPQQ